MNEIAIDGRFPGVSTQGGREHSVPGRLRQLDGQGWIGLALSAAILTAVGVQIGKIGLADAMRAAPHTFGFWAVFALSYLLAPATEWVMFRRLWRLPVAGFGALLRKNVANELVLGYSGEAHFYLWARRHANLAASPFGAVKDVAMLSAVAGNAATLVLMAWNWPVLDHMVAGAIGRAFAWSIVMIAATSLVLFLLRRTLFSLARRDILFVFVAHLVRIVVSLALTALLWRLLLPTLSVHWLVVLATLRTMLSRLPLLPAKDVIFAGLVAGFLGRSASIVPAVTLLASLTVVAHVVIGLCSSTSALVAGLRDA